MPSTVDWAVMAAWVQAVGGIAAIVAAWIIAKSQANAAAKTAREERRIQGRSIAMALYPELLEYKAMLPSLKRALTNIRDGKHTHITESELENLVLPVPAAVQASWDQLYLLGEPAAAPIQQFLALLNQYNRLIRAMQRNIDNVTGMIPKDPAAVHLLVYPEKIETVVLEGISNISELHDGLRE